jgi:hypothetical protein
MRYLPLVNVVLIVLVAIDNVLIKWARRKDRDAARRRHDAQKRLDREYARKLDDLRNQ